MSHGPKPGEPPPRVRAAAGRERFARSAWLLPLGVGGLFLLIWDVCVRLSGTIMFPRPLEVGAAVGELVAKGLLFKYVAASMFRITWGYLLAVAVGVPVGLALGCNRAARRAFNPLVQIFRPISPIAWIPVAILWFGVTDAAPIFLIFLASVFPIVVASMAAVGGVPPVYLRAGRNFGLSPFQVFHRVILPATLPQVLTGLRIALGIAWMVVVAAEMIAANSGLGYLIVDARNAGRRYDLVVAGMVLIGLIGWGLDALMRQLEHLPGVRWGYGNRNE